MTTRTPPHPPHRRARRAAAALFGALLALLLLPCAQARFEWRDVEQRVTLERDGGVRVEDSRTLWTDEDFGEAFLCIEHGPDVEVELLPGSGALDAGPPARAYSQPCESGAAGTELVVAQEARTGARRVRWNYRLQGAVDAYSDVVQWYWNVLERDHPPVIGYRLQVDAPGPMAAPYDAFVHRYDNPEEPRVVLSDDRARLQVTFERIPPGDGVEVRFLMPPELFALAGATPGLEALLRDEAELARIDVPGAPTLEPDRSAWVVDAATVAVGGRVRDPDGVERVRYRLADAQTRDCRVDGERFECAVTDLPVGRSDLTLLAYDAAGDIGSATVALRRRSLAERVASSPWWGLLPLALVAWLASGVWGAYRRHGREPELPTMRYPFEPPSDVPPAAVTAMRMQRFQAHAMGDAFAATIMDLARRGYGAFTGERRRFEMRLDLERGEHELLPFERDVLHYLKAAAASRRRGDPALLELAELKRYSQKNGQRFLQRWAPEVRAWTEAHFGGPLLSADSRRAARNWALASVGGALACAALALALLDVAQWLAFAGAAGCALLLLLALAALPAWRPEVAREVYGWRGFQRTLTDYTRMKDAPADFFVLWDRYYCYAAAMGVAERFLRTLRRAAPLAGVDEVAMAQRATWMGVSGTDLGSVTQAMSQVTASASALSSALSAASASASSGGSVSGGGGGGGGGSSGGR